ncbi:Uncharacterised protein [Mycobacteroides abscessus subsp. abscessus]|nr:Uncharacterised protein [Mycobacteroides abscessus subsp. abscessus]
MQHIGFHLRPPRHGVVPGGEIVGADEHDAGAASAQLLDERVRHGGLSRSGWPVDGDDAGHHFRGEFVELDIEFRCHGGQASTRRPDNARPSVSSSANSRSPPIGRPEARRVTDSPGKSLSMRRR